MKEEEDDKDYSGKHMSCLEEFIETVPGEG